MTADPAGVLAPRLYGQRLTDPVEDPLDALRGWTIQDSPPGAAVAAISARTASPLDPGWLDRALYEDRSVVALYNARTATAILPADEAAAFGTSMIPDDETGLEAIVGTALPDPQGDYADTVRLGVEGIADALDGTPLSRDDLHEALRRRLPADLLPWCKGCESHHARRGLLVMASLHGRLCLAGHVGRQPLFTRTDQWIGWTGPPREEAAAALVHRYRTAYGPSTPKHFVEWAGLGNAHARTLWEAAGDETPPAPAEPPTPEGVRLIAPGDPLLLGRDREALIPDPAVRRKLWPAINPPGLVLAGAQPVALARGRKQGKKLSMELEAIGPKPAAKALQAEADRLAPLRGCTSATVSWR